ncbi:hypothetical protein L1987_80728 [Smallanthus sonchifolius]|uniref:Uncharacterized protein n=1 Tax=Smallanthus sonchifolius TaxID=185202 RepID=A0ACB8YP16_9ASTR|nr:hypothetical protein L1987_80728 [Smallanthus sonchifolius]
MLSSGFSQFICINRQVVTGLLLRLRSDQHLQLKRIVNKMPSLQTALPPELADNAIRLYRECLRRAKYIGHKQHNTELVVQMVRQQFKKHMHETDPEKIQKLKDDAARGLINHILYEAEAMTGRKFS